MILKKMIRLKNTPIFRILVVFLLLFSCVRGQSQSLKRANIHFKNGEYAKAIPIYRALIANKKNVASAKSKLAESLRKLNKIEEAAPIYAEIVADSSANLRADDLAHYGEVLLMMGKYDSATLFLNRAKQLDPDKPQYDALLRSAQAAPSIKTLFETDTVVVFAHNFEGDDNAPFFLGDDLIFSSDRRSARFFPANNAATGRYYVNIFMAKSLNTDSSKRFEYAPPSKYDNQFSESSKNSSNASFSANGNYIFYCQNDVNDSKSNTYNLQLFSARKQKKSWKSSRKLNFCTPEANYLHPAISPDGNTLFFVAERSGGQGGTDIWTSQRESSGKWSKPENLGDKVNTSANEGFPFATADGRLFFCSRGHTGMGGYDIFVTKKFDNGEWEMPRNLGAPFNSPHDDLSFCLHQSGASGAFASSRGGQGDDIFLFSLKESIFPPLENIENAPPPVSKPSKEKNKAKKTKSKKKTSKKKKV